MIIHLKLALLTIFLVETIIFFKTFDLILKTIKILKKLFQLFILKNVSDYWKEKVLFNYSKNIFIYSLKIILYFLSAIIFLWVLLSYDVSLKKNLLSIIGILETIIIAVAYLRLKKLL